MTALTLRVWVTGAAGWLPAAALAAAGTCAVAVAYLTSAVAALPLLALTCSAATTAFLPARRRPVRECRAARPRRDAPAAPGARRTRPAQGVRGGCAHTLPGGGSGSPFGVVRHPANHRPAAAPSPRTPAAAVPAYRVGRAAVPTRGAR